MGENGVIKNCNVEGEVTATAPAKIVGGIAGKSSGLIINCSFKGTVTYTHITEGGPYGFLGGIVGYHNMGNVVACRSYIELNSLKDTAGGIVGNAGYDDPDIVACYAHITGLVSNLSSGAILGQITNKYDIFGSYWSKESGLEKPKNGYEYTWASGQNTREATQVTDGNWTGEPMSVMNETLSNSGYGYQYEANTGEDRNVFPLIVKEVE